MPSFTRKSCHSQHNSYSVTRFNTRCVPEFSKARGEAEDIASCNHTLSRNESLIMQLFNCGINHHWWDSAKVFYTKVIHSFWWDSAKIFYTKVIHSLYRLLKQTQTDFSYLPFIKQAFFDQLAQTAFLLHWQQQKSHIDQKEFWEQRHVIIMPYVVPFPT